MLVSVKDCGASPAGVSLKITGERNLLAGNLHSMYEILQAASDGRYAVGAFNFTALVDLQAAVQAAEEERSPLILQIHPAKGSGCQSMVLLRLYIGFLSARLFYCS